MSYTLGPGIVNSSTGEPMVGMILSIRQISAFDHKNKHAVVEVGIWYSEAAKAAGNQPLQPGIVNAIFDDASLAAGDAAVLGFSAVFGAQPTTHQDLLYDDMLTAAYGALPTHPVTKTLLIGATAC
jgi:hypothetical protein